MRTTALTPMERKLVKGIARGLTKKEAGTLAGYKPSAVDSCVSAALKRDRVKMAIQRALDKAGLKDDVIAETLKKTMKGAGHRATNSDAIRAIEVIGKIRGWNEPEKENTINNTYINELKVLNVNDLKARADQLSKEIKELTQEE